MIADKICRYLSHLDSVQVADTNESGSRYFNAPGVKIRVSDHIACSYNPTTTLNIVCDTRTEMFSVFYGSRIIPITDYSHLRELLRNFVMVCDILAPLADIRNKSKVVEKVVTVERPIPTSSPSQDSDEWLWVGDLPDDRRKGCQRNVDNVRYMIAHHPSPKKKKK